MIAAPSTPSRVRTSSSQASNPDAKATSPYYVNGSANPSDQYVAKHNPLAWFDSLLPAAEGGTGGNTCAEHLAPIFGQNDQLYTDLQQASSTPDFSYIFPNNCSNGHDSVCAGNNLSGVTSNSTTASSISRCSNCWRTGCETMMRR